MIFIILTIIIFLELVMYFVFFDVILSWLMLAGVRFRPRFLYDVLDPIYSYVRRFIPTCFGPFDFTAIIIIFGIIFIRSLLQINFPEVNQILSLTSM